jgi:CTP:molybdopterin cytidylyltransferase MocA
MLGDQPHLQEKTLRTLLNCGAANRERICQPLRSGHRRHPVLLPKALFGQLKDTSAGDLKLFLVDHAQNLAGFESDDEGLDLDMDTPEDYERAWRLVSRRTKES